MPGGAPRPAPRQPPFVGFDGRARRGALVVHHSAARDVVTAFRALYRARFPIRRMRPIQAYGATTSLSIEADNTSAFNCRSATGSSRWSEHAYGRAIDINPIENPYVSGGRTSHRGERRLPRPVAAAAGTAVEGGALVEAFDAVGWGWGGRWSSIVDYQHFLGERPVIGVRWPKSRIALRNERHEGDRPGRYGAPERVLRLEEIDRPPVGDDDVLIRVRATSVNTPDWITVTGVPYILRLRSGLRGPRTPVRGTDVAGVVEAAGRNVTDLQPGDEVFGSSWGLPRHAGHLRRAHGRPGVPAHQEAPRAHLRRGCSIRHVGPHRADRHPRRGQGSDLGPGSWSTARRGGVGTLAVQIARALGADVTGVCSTRNLELVRLPRRGPRHRLHAGRLHPRRAALRRHPRQRDEPPALGHGPGADAHGNAHSEQRGQHGRRVRGAAEDGAGGRDGAGLDRCAVRHLRRGPPAPGSPRSAPRVRRRQGGHRRGLPAGRGRQRGRPHAGTSRPGRSPSPCQDGAR